MDIYLDSIQAVSFFRLEDYCDRMFWIIISNSSVTIYHAHHFCLEP